MKLKSIRANGFKSFADKIDIELKTNITAIVGPNGSGKSNIVDAIRWVLGEQSVKSLRGSSSMSDVIFKGSETRKPLKRAEVTLTFDNESRFLNTEHLDVEVKRVLYHTGENEYFINNTKVRLKDITTLFLDSGIGGDSLNIISQGSVESIVNGKPIDRRIILESAASVLKYKTRKLESVRKLEKTKDNLEKVSLVTDELAITVEPLKEQSEIAKKYLEYKKELEDLEISLTTYDITNIHSTYNVLLKEVKELEEKKESLEILTNKKNGDGEGYRLELLNLEEKIQNENKKLIELNENLSHKNSEKTLLLERQNYEIDKTKIDENLINYKEQELALQKEETLLKEDEKKLAEELNLNKQYRSNNEEARSILNIKRKHLDGEIESTSRNEFIIKNKINLLEANLEQDVTLPVSVKNVLNNPRLTGIEGTIGKIIDVEEKFVTAIDVALSSSSNFIITKNDTDAKKAISYLKENKLGRATFFPMNLIKSRYILASEIDVLKEEPCFIGIASDLVSCDEKYANIIKNQLGNVLVVDTMDSLNIIGRKINYKYRVVSLDGEILHAGGSLTGGSIKRTNTTLKDKKELENLKIELENNRISLKNLEEKKEVFEKEEQELVNFITTYEKKIVINEEALIQKRNALTIVENKLKEVKEYFKSATTLKSGTIEDTLVKVLEEIKNLEIEKERTTKNLDNYRKRKSEVSSEIACIEAEYKDKNSEYHKIESELKRHEIEIGKYDTKMDYLLQLLSDEYHMTYEKAKQDYSLDLEPELARMKVSKLKKDISSLGIVNVGSIEEYERISERYNFLIEQKSDLEKSCDDLYEVIDEMDSIMKEKLEDAFEKIQKEFSIVFKKMFKGGVGMLKLTDPDNILETGIDIIAEPPGKKLNNIQLLSGGEKTLTAISLLFAILNVYPVPFCVLDEVEAALDEANVDTFGAYLEEQEEKSEFILITHKKRTMEYAKTLYGITMQEQGVSKIVSVSLEDKNI